MREIITILDKKGEKGYSQIVSTLLGLSVELNDLKSLSLRALTRQKETNLLQPIHIPGNLTLSLFYFEDNVNYENIGQIKKHACSNLIITVTEKAAIVRLKYNQNVLHDIDFEYCLLSDLTQSERQEAEEFASWLKENRVKKYLKNNNLKKIDRNDQCPCGSGKKYKKCCLKLGFY